MPPLQEEAGWRPLMSSLSAAHPAMQALAEENQIEVHPLALRWGSLLAAYALEEPAHFRDALTGYQLTLKREAPELLKYLRFEVAFNRTNAFVKSAVLYLIVALLSCVGWLLRREGLLYWARCLLVWTAVPHTLALIARSLLSGYPPVTNLYSSAIFIGWGAVIMGIILEGGFKKRPSGMASLVGGLTGFLTLLIAHFLAGEGDTLEQMRAVLDTGFVGNACDDDNTWIYGYVHSWGGWDLYILAGLGSRRLDNATQQEMDRILYGTAAFALFVEFCGNGFRRTVGG